MSIRFSGKVGKMNGVKIFAQAVSRLLSYIMNENNTKVRLESGDRVLREKQD